MSNVLVFVLLLLHPCIATIAPFLVIQYIFEESYIVLMDLSRLFLLLFYSCTVELG